MPRGVSARASERSSCFLLRRCVSAGLVFASIHALARESAEPADASASRPASVCRTPATPLDMALRLSASWRGARACSCRTRSGGSGWTAVSSSGRCGPGVPGRVPGGARAGGGQRRRGVARASCADDQRRHALYNAAGELLLVGRRRRRCLHAGLIARLHSIDGTVADFFDTERVYQDLLARPCAACGTDRIIYRSAWLSTRQYFLPSHAEMASYLPFWEDLGVYRSGGRRGRAWRRAGALARRVCRAGLHRHRVRRTALRSPRGRRVRRSRAVCWTSSSPPLSPRPHGRTRRVAPRP